MARAMRRLKDDESKATARQKRQKERQLREPVGKSFAELSTEEKDDILKRLAIMAGLVEE